MCSETCLCGITQPLQGMADFPISPLHSHVACNAVTCDTISQNVVMRACVSLSAGHIGVTTWYDVDKYKKGELDGIVAMLAKQLRETTVSFTVPVRPSTCNSAVTGRICAKFGIGDTYWNWSALPIRDSRTTTQRHIVHEDLHSTWLVTFHMVTRVPIFSLATKFTSVGVLTTVSQVTKFTRLVVVNVVGSVTNVTMVTKCPSAAMVTSTRQTRFALRTSWFFAA